MKYLIRVWLFNVFALWIATQLVPAFQITGQVVTVLLAGLTLSLLMIFIKPLLKILFIPINILTFGLFSWFINVILMYLLTIVMPEVKIYPWTFPGFSWAGFVIPVINFSYLLTLIIISLMITFFSNLLHQVSEG